MTTPDSSTAAEPAWSSAAEAETAFARDSGPATSVEFAKDYFGRLRGGEVGALPAILGVVVLILVFARQTPRFLTPSNLANLVSQSGITVFIAMGLIFVLLLGEIDLAAGTASGVCAAVMAVAVNHGTDMRTALGTSTFVGILIFMAVGLVIAVSSRLWIGVGIIAVGMVMLVTNLFAGNPWGAIYLALAVGVSIGLFTGFLVARIGIPSFVVTLALFLAWQGVLLQIEGNGSSIPVSGSDTINALANSNAPPAVGWAFFAVAIIGYGYFTVSRSIRRRAHGLSAEPMPIVLGRLAVLTAIGAVGLALLNQERGPNPTVVSVKGAPWALPIIVVFMIIWTIVLNRTQFGRYMYAVGGNAEAARRAGVDLKRIRIAAFMIGSGMAALGGVIQASRLGAVPSDAGGRNTLLYGVAAAVIGGTSLFGGRGRARDAVIGGLVIAIIPNGLGLIPNLPSSYEFMITGIVLLVAASVDALTRKGTSSGGA